MIVVMVLLIIAIAGLAFARVQANGRLSLPDMPRLVQDL